MIVLCYGLPKSASTFAFQLASGLVEAAGFAQAPLYRRYLPPDLAPYPPQPYFVQLAAGDLTRIVAGLPEEQLMVVKLHGPLHSDIHNLLDTGACRALCTHRDPRDAAVSLFDAAQRERRRQGALRREAFTAIDNMDQCIDTIADRLGDALPWMAHEKVQALDFAGLQSDPYGRAVAIADYLGLDADDGIDKRIDRRIDPGAVLLDYLLDKRRIGEFNVGTAGRYHTVMTAAQEQRAADAFAAWFDRAGAVA